MQLHDSFYIFYHSISIFPSGIQFRIQRVVGAAVSLGRPSKDSRLLGQKRHEVQGRSKRTGPRICWTHLPLSFHSSLLEFAGMSTKHKVELVMFWVVFTFLERVWIWGSDWHLNLDPSSASPRWDLEQVPSCHWTSFPQLKSEEKISLMGLV